MKRSMNRLGAFVIAVAALSLIGCRSEPAKTKEEIAMDKAVGIFDMQYNPSQIAYMRTLKKTDQKPFATVEIKQDRSFKILLMNKGADGKQKAGLAEGKITANGNTITMTADKLNRKPADKPRVLVYSLSDDGTVLMHKDGTTFLRRTDPKIRSGNANIDAYLEKEAAERQKAADAQKARKDAAPPVKPPTKK